MNFDNFLKVLLDRTFWQSRKVLCFRGKSCEHLFFHFLWDKLTQLDILPFPKKSLGEDLLKNNFELVLGHGVLGMSSFYWLGDLSGQGKKDKLINYIQRYNGPHVIAFFTSGDIGKFDLSVNVEIIDISFVVSVSEFNSLMQILGNKITAKKLTVARQIFEVQKEISPDIVCIMINYLDLVSTNMIEGLPGYLDHIIGSQPALNQLSNYFFARQAKPFFEVWSELESKYPEIFWVNFWGEQIWRAFHVVEYMKNRDFVKAKQISYGLPYTFINKSWSLFNREYLHNLYKDLYNIDYSIKMGSSFCSLDLFYLSHFK